MENKALIILLLLFLILTPGYVHAKSQNSPHLLIYEVSPYPPSRVEGEYICIYNPLRYGVNLSSYQLTDFEGTLTLGGSIAANSYLYVAQNRTAFHLLMGFYPDYTYNSLHSRGRFSLGNEGDEVALTRDGMIVDIVVYGKSHYHGGGWIGTPLHVSKGHILQRRSIMDTDSANDWTTYHRIGQSNFPSRSFNASLQIFIYPDDWKIPLKFVNGAKHTLWIESYQLNSWIFARTLISVMHHGVSVRILLEGAPVGGIDEREKYVVNTLWKHGAKIRFMKNNDTLHISSRYRFVHSKIIIRDENATLISTENFVESALSPCGNRGYGVVIHNSSFARYMLNVIRDDWKSHGDIMPYMGEYESASYEPYKRMELRRKVFAPLNLTSRIIPVISPDFSYDKLNEFIDSQHKLFLEAPYVDSFAMRIFGNKVARGLVNHALKFKNFRKFDSRNLYVHSLHGKLLIGTNAVFFGSMNFAQNSIFDNREISLIIESAKISEYLKRVFEYDWNAYQKPHIKISLAGEGEWYLLNFNGSIGNITRYRVYLDGKTVYNGTQPWCKIFVGHEKHTLMAEVVDSHGERSSIKLKIGNKNESLMGFEWWKYLYLSILFAVFFYKVWKDHG